MRGRKGESKQKGKEGETDFIPYSNSVGRAVTSASPGDVIELQTLSNLFLPPRLMEPESAFS